MAYFDGVKIGDKVWSFEFGWGTVKELIYNSPYPIGVVFDNEQYETFTLDGKVEKSCNQTLFWNEVKFEVPKKTKLELKEYKYLVDLSNCKISKVKPIGCEDKIGLFRNDEETAKKALKQIKRYTRLLALRDQECPDSRGYVFKYEKQNWYIYKQNCGSDSERYEVHYSEFDCLPCCIYFKTKEDAQKICDILNSGRFDLEGE